MCGSGVALHLVCTLRACSAECSLRCTTMQADAGRAFTAPAEGGCAERVLCWCADWPHTRVQVSKHARN